ncbi:MAG: hypothetical protein RL562_1567, partial [Planctomycetota bacterium]
MQSAPGWSRREPPEHQNSVLGTMTQALTNPAEVPASRLLS